MKSTPAQVPSAAKVNFLLDKEQMTDRIITAKVKKQLSLFPLENLWLLL